MPLKDHYRQTKTRLVSRIVLGGDMDRIAGTMLHSKFVPTNPLPPPLRFLRSSSATSEGTPGFPPTHLLLYSDLTPGTQCPPFSLDYRTGLLRPPFPPSQLNGGA